LLHFVLTIEITIIYFLYLLYALKVKDNFERKKVSPKEL